MNIIKNNKTNLNNLSYIEEISLTFTKTAP